jgi:hypothetical protein
MVTGLIPNQIFVNKMFAMTQISLMTSAYPKIVYDKTRVAKWDNRVGAAIGINGGDVTNVAKIIDPAQISPQISQFIDMTVGMTQELLGATSAALGNTRPDNTSAIIALQRASSVPMEIQKDNLHKAIEDLGRIYIDFMRAYYGLRFVDVAIDPARPAPQVFDFKSLNAMPLSVKLDVGASAYWSEIASVQTLDNLLMQNKITTAQYLERVPSGYIPKKQELINEIKAMLQMGIPPEAQQSGDGAIAAPMDTQNMPLPDTTGNAQLQRAIVKTGAA